MEDIEYLGLGGCCDTTSSSFSSEVEDFPSGSPGGTEVCNGLEKDRLEDDPADGVSTLRVLSCNFGDPTLAASGLVAGKFVVSVSGSSSADSSPRRSAGNRESARGLMGTELIASISSPGDGDISCGSTKVMPF